MSLVLNDVMQVVEYEMLQAALVSWAVTHVMDAVLSIQTAFDKLTWRDAMRLVTLVIAPVAMLAVYTICSAVIVVGACLEWLAHVARAAGILCFQLYCKCTPLQGFSLYGQPLRQLTIVPKFYF